MNEWFINAALAILVIILIWSFAYILAKKTRIPYTILLILFWMWLIPLSHINYFHFITDFKLTPEVLFFVFLPILIFESGYSMWYRDVLKNWKSISLLAVVGLLISTFVTWYALHLILRLVWLNIPLEVTILFWSIISATDTVSVLALFKEFWAPKRLALIFEWESLFNDWTTLALYTVVIGIINSWVLNAATFWKWFLTFIVMVFWWIIFWLFMWMTFSKLIEKIKWNENIEVVFTMLVAYMTFILSELISEHIIIWWFALKISWVVATAMAAIVIGNYWKYKISYRVQDYMEKFWSFMAFVVNSLVFILMWIMFFKLNINFKDFILPIVVAIFSVIVARWFSVYIPIWFLNILKIEEKIPSSWQNLLAWGSLRWVISMMMVLMIPDNFNLPWWAFDFSVKEFLLSITIWTVIFTLLIKSTTIWYVIKKLWINSLYEQEVFEKEESNVLINLEILDKFEKLFSTGQISEVEYDLLKKLYSKKLNQSLIELKEILKSKWDWANEFLKKVISLHSLWAEKHYLKELFRYNEIDEYVFKYMIRTIDRKIEILEDWEEWAKSKWTTIEIKLIDKLLNYIYTRKDNIVYKYIKYRTKYIISNKIIHELQHLKKIDWWFEKTVFDEVISHYQEFWDKNKQKMEDLYSENKTLIDHLDLRLTKKSLIKFEEKTLNTLYSKQYLTQKLYVEFSDQIEAKISKDINALI